MEPTMIGRTKATRAPYTDTLRHEVFAVWLHELNGVISHAIAKQIYDCASRARGGGTPKYSSMNVSKILRLYGRKTTTRMWNSATKRWNAMWVMDDSWMADSVKPTTAEQLIVHHEDEHRAREQVSREDDLLRRNEFLEWASEFGTTYLDAMVSKGKTVMLPVVDLALGPLTLEDAS